MDDLENKNSVPENDEELEKSVGSLDVAENSENSADSFGVSDKDEETAGSLPENNAESDADDKEFLETQINELVEKMKTKNEEKILKDDVQDWDGLIDDSRQDAEDYILNESSEISDDKIESIEVMEIDEDDDRLCSICHRRLKMTANGVTYEYCRRCRNELLDTKYNWKSVLTFIVSCVVLVFAVSISSVAVVNTLGVKKAESFLEDGKLISASNAYQTLLASTTKSEYAPTTFEDLFTVDPGDKAAKNYVIALYKSGDFSTLKSALATYFPEKELEKPENADVKEINEVVTGLYAVGTKAGAIINTLAQPVDMEAAQKAIDELEDLKKDDSLDPTYLTYYQYYVTTMLPEEYELQLEYLDKLKAEAPDLKVFYVTSYASTYLYMQQYDKCFEYCDEALKDNAEEYGAIRLKIRALIRQKKYDEALALSDKAISSAKKIYVASSEDTPAPDVTYAYGVHLERAILYGIKGEMKKAQDAIDKAYQGQMTLDSIYLYAMINKKNGNDEAYDEIASMLEQYQMTIPQICEDYISGKKSFEDIFVNGKVAWYE